jgi:hypothetical protein
MLQKGGKVVDTFWEATLGDLKKVSSRIETCLIFDTQAGFARNPKEARIQ